MPVCEGYSVTRHRLCQQTRTKACDRCGMQLCANHMHYDDPCVVVSAPTTPYVNKDVTFGPLHVRREDHRLDEFCSVPGWLLGCVQCDVVEWTMSSARSREFIGLHLPSRSGWHAVLVSLDLVSPAIVDWSVGVDVDAPAW